MVRKIILTDDGSHSISVPGKNVMYHSVHGAIQESMHVFIHAGLKQLVNQMTINPIAIFEMGFGTGLNALLTLIEAERTGTEIYYETIEPFPLAVEETRQLNYCDQLNRPELQPVFERLHNCEWEKEIAVNRNFFLLKNRVDLLSFLSSPGSRQALKPFNLIYFDAFAPNAQPELWTKEVFDKLYTMIVNGGMLVTYCSKGDVRRAMQAAGFNVEKLPGAAGKREMLRAWK